MKQRKPPRDSTEIQVCTIWKSVLSVDNVGLDDDFFERGGDSLKALKIINEVEQSFRVTLGLQDFLSQSTVSALAQYIRENQYAYETSPLVRISAGSAADPLYVFHAISGTVMRYVHFARALNGEWPVWGLESVPFQDEESRPLTIETMVELYLEFMRSEHSGGPWRLMGYSLGGMLAYEAARRLKEDGEHVEMLVLVDTPIPIPANEPEPSAIWQNGIRSFAERLVAGHLDVSWLIEQDPDVQIRQLLTKAQEVGTLPEDYDSARLTHMLETRVINRLAGGRFRPQPYNGDMILIRGLETVNHLTAPPSPGNAHMFMNWAELVDRVFTHDHLVPHLEMLSAENVASIADIVMVFLRTSK